MNCRRLQSHKIALLFNTIKAWAIIFQIIALNAAEQHSNVERDETFVCGLCSNVHLGTAHEEWGIFNLDIGVECMYTYVDMYMWDWRNVGRISTVIEHDDK